MNYLIPLLIASLPTGAALKDALRVAYRPDSYVSSPSSAISSITTVDGLTGEKVSAACIPLASPSWVQLNPELSRAFMSDLYNLRPTIIDHPGLPYAPVAEPTATYGKAKRGYGTLTGQPIEAVEPSDDMKGDVARTMFYIATVYSPILWCDWGGAIFDSARQLTLSEDIAEIYLAWNDSDPVSPEEKALCESIFLLQGNENPFVTHPEYAAMIWGKTTEKPDDNDNDTPPVPPQDNPTPLKAVYSATNDATIYLMHPSVDVEASWSIDGRHVDSNSIATSSLTRGRHELRFIHGSTKGKLIITVTE